MDKIPVIGITGGPATGKSLVAAGFRDLGASLVDADVIARDVLRPGRAEFDAVVSCFGPSVVARDGTLERKVLGNIVFSDYRRLAELTAITRPAIIAIIRENIAALKEAAESALIVLDAPLLFEAGLAAEMDKIIVVCTDEEVQLKRLMKRDGITEQWARKLIASQMPLAEKKNLAHYLINNNGSRGETLIEVQTLYKSLILENG